MVRHLDPFRRTLTLVCILGVCIPSAVGARADEFTVPLDLPAVEISRGADETVEFHGAGVQWQSLPGQPQIPWQVLDVLLPQDAAMGTVRIALDRAQFDLVEGLWNVGPAPLYRTAPTGGPDDDSDGAAPSSGDGRDMAVYATDDFWPGREAELAGTGQFRQWKIARIAVPLFRYNPVRKRLKRLADAGVRVRFERVLQAQAQVEAGPGRDIGENFLEEMVVNYEQQKGSYQHAAGSDLRLTAADRPGYAIITTGDIVAASQELARFIAHKEARGFAVQLVTEDDFGGGVGNTAADNIRRWLQRHYRADNILYVLLIGNPHPFHGRVPMKMLWPMNDGDTSHLTNPDHLQKHSPSDYYYADLTGNWDLDDDGYYGEWGDDFGDFGVDRCWDVLVGRIPCYERVTTGMRVLYDSGPPRWGVVSGEHYYRGYLCGNVRAGQEQRWLAHPFTLPTGRGDWHITCIGADYYLDTNYDRDFDLVGYIVWRRAGQSKPREADIITQGTVSAPLHEDDPGVSGSENWRHHIQVSFDLPPGDYYLTIYAERSDGKQGCALQWMVNTEFGIPLVDPSSNPNPGVRAFVWRSEMFPDPGFQVYNMPPDEWSAAPGDDPLQLYTGAFTIYGEPARSGGTASPTSQAPDVGPLDHILSKIMSYENAPERETQWRTRMLLAIKGEEDCSPPRHMFGEEIRTKVLAGKPEWSCFRIYDEQYGLTPPPDLTSCTVDNVAQSWTASPFGVVVWATHGAETYAVDVFSHLRAAGLDDTHPAFTFQNSCLTAHPETRDNLAYTLLKNGAIATVGATRIAGDIAEGNVFAGTPASGGLAIEYLTALIRYEKDAGYALCNAKRMLQPKCNAHWLNWCDYNLYGCPAVGLYSHGTDSTARGPAPSNR